MNVKYKQTGNQINIPVDEMVNFVQEKLYEYDELLKATQTVPQSSPYNDPIYYTTQEGKMVQIPDYIQQQAVSQYTAENAKKIAQSFGNGNRSGNGNGSIENKAKYNASNDRMDIDLDMDIEIPPEVGTTVENGGYYRPRQQYRNTMYQYNPIDNHVPKVIPKVYIVEKQDDSYFKMIILFLAIGLIVYYMYTKYK